MLRKINQAEIATVCGAEMVAKDPNATGAVQVQFRNLKGRRDKSVCVGLVRAADKLVAAGYDEGQVEISLTYRDRATGKYERFPRIWINPSIQVDPANANQELLEKLAASEAANARTQAMLQAMMDAQGIVLPDTEAEVEVEADEVIEQKEDKPF